MTITTFGLNLVSGPASDAALWLIDAALKSTALLVAVGIAAWLLRRRSAAAIHRLWTLGFCGCLLMPIAAYVAPLGTLPILPNLSAPVIDSEQGSAVDQVAKAELPFTRDVGSNPAEEDPFRQDMLIETATADVRVLVQAPAAAALSPTPTTSSKHDRVSWPRVLLIVWLAGVALCVARWVWQHAILRQVVRRCRPVDAAEWSSAVSQASHLLGFSGSTTLVTCDAARTPAVAGVLQTIVILPPNAGSWTAERRQFVLLHELAHAQRRDLLTHAIARAACSVYWFNPLCWLGMHQMAKLRELACDDLVLASGQQATDYADALLDVARSYRPKNLGLAVGMARRANVEDRILAILDRARNRMTVSPRAARRWAVGTLVAVLLLGSLRMSTPAEPAAAAAPSVAAGDSAGAVPTLDELMQAFAVHERAYGSFHIKAMETFVMSEGLTDQERSQFPWADGRKHQRLMAFAQLKPGTWMSQETHVTDDVSQPPYSQYVNDGRQVSVSHRPNLVGSIDVHLQDPDRPPSDYVWAEPLMGLFPLSSGPQPALLNEAVQQKETQTQVDADGENVKLTVVHGPANSRQRFVLWLSRVHGWFPIRHQRFLRRDKDTEILLSEWEAGKLEQQAGQWRVTTGRVQWFEFLSQATSPKKTYAVDFEVLEATYGDAVAADLFKFEIPADAVVYDPTKPRIEEVELTRDFPVTVIDVNGNPLPGATVISKTRALTAPPRELASSTTDEQGLATVRAPDCDFGLGVHKEGFRESGWIMGGPTTEMRVILAPVTAGRTVDDTGSPLQDVWVSSNSDVRFRSDGLIHEPRNNMSAVHRSAWSDAQGRFVLTSELTLRRTKDPVLISAVTQSQDRMAFVHVPATELAQPLTLVLRPACAIEGSCLLEGIRQPLDIRMDIEDTEGRTLADFGTAASVVEQGLRVAFKFRMPPGEYRLQSRRTSLHSTISIPLEVPEEQSRIQLGEQVIQPSGIHALIGKPAPALAGTWRAGEETSLEALRGNVVVLDFWGYWCGPCLAGMPHLMDIADSFKDRPVKWLAIHDPHELTREYLEQRLADITRDQWKGRALSFPVMIDASSGDDERSGVTGQRYDVREWPTLILIDRDGNVAGVATHDNLREKIEALLD